MEEKERYEIRHEDDGFDINNDFIDYIVDTKTGEYFTHIKICDLLNQQDKRIKELKGRIKTLKTSKAHFKKISENVVDLLLKLNKFIGSPQIRDLNYYKVIEDTKNYIEQLKQSQKQLAISELKKVKQLLDEYKWFQGENKYSFVDDCAVDWTDIEKVFNNKIKELGGGENE